MAMSLPQDIDYICGIESGGSYYASSLADLMSCKLILFRSKAKIYGNKMQVVGEIPGPGKKILLVDDVLATGKTIAKVNEFFKALDVKVIVCCVFSYGYEKMISKKIGVKIISASNYEACKELDITKKIAGQEKLEIIDRYLENYPNLIWEKNNYS
jgi:orotate phosphoribosyltransferase